MLTSAKISWAILAVLGAAVQAQQVPSVPASSGRSLPFTIVDPTADSMLVGPSVLKVDVAPATIAVKTVEFFVDGTRVCEVDKPPFECSFDAGARIAARLVRVVANFAYLRTAYLKQSHRSIRRTFQ
jgi:hypothetical protein